MVRVFSRGPARPTPMRAVVFFFIRARASASWGVVQHGDVPAGLRRDVPAGLARPGLPASGGLPGLQPGDDLLHDPGDQLFIQHGLTSLR